VNDIATAESSFAFLCLFLPFSVVESLDNPVPPRTIICPLS